MQSEEIKKIFPSFDTKLAEEIAKKSEIKTFKQGDLIMKKGQYMRSTMLLVSGLKFAVCSGSSQYTIA